MKINYTIKQIYPGIFAIVVKDDYDRASLFCRIQEFYESNCKKFNKKSFSIFDYYRWYSKKHADVFSYTSDWSGFNLPLETALLCQSVNKVETPYDLIMNKILQKISTVFTKNKSYIIGVKTLNDTTFKHELCHAFYYSNSEYKEKMDKITESINKNDYKKMKNCLLSLGYNKKVINDEIQAYMATEIDEDLCQKIKNKKELHSNYKKVFKSFLARY